MHNGNDGTCGTPCSSTTRGLGSGGVLSPSPGIPPAAGVPTIVDGRGVREGPRVPSPRCARASCGDRSRCPRARRRVDVRISVLRRTARATAAHSTASPSVRARSLRGHGSSSRSAASESFSYLLPSALAPGRYVFDIEATDAAGQAHHARRGRTVDVVFYVSSERHATRCRTRRAALVSRHGCARASAARGRPRWRALALAGCGLGAGPAPSAVQARGHARLRRAVAGFLQRAAGARPGDGDEPADAQRRA